MKKYSIMLCAMMTLFPSLGSEGGSENNDPHGKKRAYSYSSSEEEIPLKKQKTTETEKEKLALAPQEGELEQQLKALAPQEGELEQQLKALAPQEGELEQQLKALAQQKSELEGQLVIEGRTVPQSTHLSQSSEAIKLRTALIKVDKECKILQYLIPFREELATANPDQITNVCTLYYDWHGEQFPSLELLKSMNNAANLLKQFEIPITTYNKVEAAQVCSKLFPELTPSHIMATTCVLRYNAEPQVREILSEYAKILEKPAYYLALKKGIFDEYQ